jgi:arylsulfatase A-like enzyme
VTATFPRGDELRPSTPTDREPQRRWLPILAALALLGVSAACRETLTSRPNVLILSLDTLRADHLSLYGYERPTSPTLDSLAAESVVFDNALAQSSATLPSHHSLFQSRLPSLVRLDLPTLAGIFRANGYRTAGFTDGGFVSKEYGFDRGFQRYDEFRGGLAVSLPKFEAWLGEGGGEPWYVFLHTYSIHTPYAPPSPYDTMFYPEYEGPVTPRGTAEICRKIRRLFEYADFNGDMHLSASDRREIEALYDGGIRYTDDLVGKLLQILRDKRLLEDTLLVILSDHGEEFWDHGSVMHGHTVYQELLRVPLVMRLPDARYGGRRVSDLVRLLDVAPTVLELAGLQRPDTFQGRSLLDVLDGPDAPPRTVVSEMGTLKARIEMPWKLILDTENRQPALFNLIDDCRERKSLADQRPDRVKALTDALRKSLPDELREVPVLPQQDVPAELRDQLRELGYVE